MHDYSAFGNRLRSELEFPELRPCAAGPPRWTFRLGRTAPEIRGAELMGEEPLYADVCARLFRHDAGFRIHVADTGTYDLSEDGSEIRWTPNPEPWWDFGRAHLLGRVLATAMHVTGWLVLHGSAVAFADGVVAFLAPKHAGKSTLALALVQAGARLVTDDTLPVVPGPEPEALPGIHALRLTGDSAAIPGSPARGPVGRDGKVVLEPMPEALVQTRAARLSALYLLMPVEALDDGGAATRSALDPVRATAGLVGSAKIGAMLGTAEAPVLLRRAAEITRTVPVYALGVVRDLDRLPDAVATIAGWHGSPSR